jgi:hypothetical protein
MVPAATSTSLGIWPTEINITIEPLKTSHTSIYIFNPGDDDMEAELYFIPEDLNGHNFDVQIYPSRMTVKRNTTPFEPEEARIIVRNNLFLKKSVDLDILGKEVEVPIYVPILGKAQFEGKVAAETLTEPTSVIVTSKVRLELVGFNKLKLFIFSVVLVSILTLKIYRDYMKKGKPKSK